MWGIECPTKVHKMYTQKCTSTVHKVYTQKRISRWPALYPWSFYCGLLLLQWSRQVLFFLTGESSLICTNKCVYIYTNKCTHTHSNVISKGNSEPLSRQLCLDVHRQVHVPVVLSWWPLTWVLSTVGALCKQLCCGESSTRWPRHNGVGRLHCTWQHTPGLIQCNILQHSDSDLKTWAKTRRFCKPVNPE